MPASLSGAHPPHDDMHEDNPPTTSDTTTASPPSRDASTPSSSPALPMEPRYIQLPDALYKLRDRYPSVTESVFLECTRCHQWIAVPVLRSLPCEVDSAPVARSVAGLDPIHTRTSSSGPLTHKLQDIRRRTEEKARDATSAVHWHSRRMREREAQPSSAAAAAAAAHGTTFYALMQQLSGRQHRQAAVALAGVEATAKALRCPLLYIPNPDTFVCTGWQCAWDSDVLADLRREWVGSLYRAMPLQTVSEASLSASPATASSPLSSPGAFPASPPLLGTDARQQRRAALNEALAEELYAMRTRRAGRSAVAARSYRAADADNDDTSSLPPLSLSPAPQPTSDLAELSTAHKNSRTHATVPTTTAAAMASISGSAGGSTLSSPAQAEVQLSRMQAAWVKAAALHLLRNGDGDEPRGGAGVDVRFAEDDHASLPAAPRDDDRGAGPLLSAFCWAICDACGKLRRVAQPFPGGAPFICAMAVTTAASCRAARAASDPHGLADNACSVSEVDGLVQCGVLLCEAELTAAALSSPFLPYPLKAQLSTRATGGAEVDGSQRQQEEGLSRADVTRVLLAEPLLRTIHSSVSAAVASSASSTTGSPGRRGPRLAKAGQRSSHRTATSPAEVVEAPTEGEATRFLENSLPVLRELARTMKKRGTTALVRQLQLTPAQIRAKREAVMRSSFLDGAPASVTAASAPPPSSAAPQTGTDPSAANASAVPAAKSARTTTAAAAAAVTASSVTPPPRARAKTAAAASGVVVSKTTTEPRSRTRSRATRAAEGETATPHTAEQPRKRGRPTRAEAAATAATEMEVEEEEEADRPQRRSRRAQAVDPATAAPAAKRRRSEALASSPTDTIAAVTDTALTAAAADAPPRRRGRPPKGGAAAEAAADAHGKKATKAEVKEEDSDGDGMDAWEVVHWVQCDRCSKWRIVPKRVPSRLKYWECPMRYDTERGRHTTCEDPDDADLSS